jgi:hypothetical protein
MRTYIAAFLLIFFLSAFIYRQSSADKVFKKLYVLEGRWIMKTKKGFIGEEWEKMNVNYLQSKGFYIKGEDTVVTERVSLKNTDGGIFYVSTVEDQNDRIPVSFKLTSSKNHRFVFENPAHDFPKRITYEFITPDSLHAYIDGGISASENRRDFYYHKVH